MAEKKEQQQLAYQQTNGYVRSSDAEGGSAALHEAARQQRKKKRTKCALYIVLFIIFQSAIVAVFALTVMKVKTPKFRFRGATVTALTAGTPAAPSLKATINPEFSVKNANFGRYKFQDTTVEFFYGGAKIGEVFVPKSKAGWRSTKKFIVSGVELSVSGSPQLATDVSGGVVPITSSAAMRGKAELIFIMKKNKATSMNCTMNIVIASQSITNIACK